MVLEHGLVHAPLDRVPLLGRQRLRMGEVEAQLVGPDLRARLVDVVAEHRPQRLVQEVGRGVVRHRREAHAPRHECLDAVALRKAFALEEQHLVVADAVGGPQHRNRAIVPLELPGVGHLPTTFRVEGRLVQLRQERAVTELLERADLGQDLGLLPADEVGHKPRGRGELGSVLGLPLPAARARDLAVALHLLQELVLIDRDAPLAGQLDGQLDGEAVGRLERERVLATDRAALGRLPKSFIPRSSVSPKRSSSARRIRSMWVWCSTSSG